jgi:sugar phosphate isomerase/epimerase
MKDDIDHARDPHRDEERDSVVKELAAKLRARGVTLHGRETSDEIGDLLDAVEDWESAVEQAGGDLYVDEGGDQPDNPDFVLPPRKAGERATDYIRRIEEAANLLRHGGSPPR